MAEYTGLPSGLADVLIMRAAVDARQVLEACRDFPPNEPCFIDLIEAMSEERLAAAMVALVALVVDQPESLPQFARVVSDA